VIVNQLPALTSDLDQAERDIATYGLCLVDGVLSADQLRRARTALYEAAADDRAQGREQPRFGLDYGDDNQRVWNVLNRDPIFAELVQHPAALRLIRAVIGWPALLGNLSANIVGPGADASMLHADQIFVPEPWPAAPQGVNVAWCLDEFTAAKRRHACGAAQPPARSQSDACGCRRVRADHGTAGHDDGVRKPRLASHGQQCHGVVTPRRFVRLVYAADLSHAGKLVSRARPVGA